MRPWTASPTRTSRRWCARQTPTDDAAAQCCDTTGTPASRFHAPAARTPCRTLCRRTRTAASEPRNDHSTDVARLRPRTPTGRTAVIHDQLYWEDVSSQKVATDRQPASPERGHHRARGPRQDDAGGWPAAAERGVPRQPAGRRARDGQHRPRARARHHHPGQEHRRPLQGHPDQHRRHARPRRLRRGSRAHAVDGRRRDAAGRRLRGPAAADALRAAQGARARAAADRRAQQDRPRRRPTAGGAERGLRPVHRPRRHRGPDRVPGALRERARRRRDDGPGQAWRQPATAVRRHRRFCAAAQGRSRRRRCRSWSPIWTRATISDGSRSAACSTAR